MKTRLIILLGLILTFSISTKANVFPPLGLPDVSYKPCYNQGEVYTAVLHYQSCPPYLELYPRATSVDSSVRWAEFKFCYHNGHLYDIKNIDGACKYTGQMSDVQNPKLTNAHSISHKHIESIPTEPTGTDDPDDPSCILREPGKVLKVQSKSL